MIYILQYLFSIIYSFIGSTVTALQPSQPAVLRIAAAKALHSFCDYLKVNGGKTLIQPYLGPAVEALERMAGEATPAALSTVLEALTLLVSVSVYVKLVSNEVV